MNERWRVAIAGLVAALAIPILVIDSPSTAEGIVESVDLAAAEAPIVEAAVIVDAEAADVDVAETVDPVTEAIAELTEAERSGPVIGAIFVRPDIDALAERAGNWQAARDEAIDSGLVEAVVIDAPSNTNLRLLPKVTIAPRSEPDQTTTTTPATTTTTPETTTTTVAPDPDPVPEATTTTTTTTSTAPDPEPAPDPADDDGMPAPPAQVDGRVPPPAGGPTAGQWNALRRCESTHNYRAISPSGLYRGAYQFSQQTWDWVAGIHWPFLVGIDPIDAEPGWQDVMAYTLYAMRGWDQWPICGKNLL